jgi:hypothetical protein
MGDSAHIEWVEYPLAWVRSEIDTHRGIPTRFVVQLEYRIDGEWRAVVRFDHDQTGEQSHDITEEGLHMDVYRNGEKYRVERGFPPVSLRRAPRYCKSYVKSNAD